MYIIAYIIKKASGLNTCFFFLFRTLLFYVFFPSFDKFLIGICAYICRTLSKIKKSITQPTTKSPPVQSHSIPVPILPSFYPVPNPADSFDDVFVVQFFSKITDMDINSPCFNICVRFPDF